MMATTHALVGAAVAAVTVVLTPEYAPLAVASGFAGGVFPDLDLYAAHRKHLHFPVYYPVAAVLAVGAAVVAPAAWTVGPAAFLVAAALHAVMDVFGGGLELEPWRGESERAVYNHPLGRWHRPRRWVRYDGAPEDALVGLVAALPLFAVTGPLFRHLVVLAVAVSVGYALVRKRIPTLTRLLVGYVPPTVRPYVPERFVE